MSNTVSVDLARRLQMAGLKWEPSMGDIIHHARWGQAIVLHAGRAIGSTVIARMQAPSGQVRVYYDDCLWLPTGDDCLEVIRSRGLYPAVAAYPESGAGPAHWGAWVSDGADECVVGQQEGDNPAEATGLALAAVMEGEKGE